MSRSSRGMGKFGRRAPTSTVERSAVGRSAAMLDGCAPLMEVALTESAVVPSAILRAG